MTEAKFVDKSSWDRGPWDDEPDRVEWRMEAHPKLACLIVRGPMGALCGYVGVPPGHPAHGKDTSLDEIADVHGGVTFAGPCMEGESPARVYHVPEPGESDNVWWIGFDCSHCYDQKPGLDSRLPRHLREWQEGTTYRPVPYVRAEVEKLAEQLAALQAGG